MKFLIKIVMVLYVCLIIYTIPCYAQDSSLSWDSIKGQADSFIKQGANQGSTYISTGDMNGLVSGLANILTTIGVVVVLAGLLIIGIKYMVATPEEAAKLKSKLVGLAVAGVVVIGAYGIWTMAYYFFNRNNQS